MQRTTRWIGLVWLALNVLSPVIGYARLASSGSGELTLELCSAAGAYVASNSRSAARTSG